MSRRKARDISFKCIYQLEYDTLNDIDKLIGYNLDDENVLDDDLEYIKSVVTGVKDNLPELDKNIECNLKEWTIERISKVDLAILRLAIYEILYIPELSNKVSANEAVELAKTYCDDNSPKFINGVLASVISKVTSSN